MKITWTPSFESCFPALDAVSIADARSFCQCMLFRPWWEENISRKPGIIFFSRAKLGLCFEPAIDTLHTQVAGLIHLKLEIRSKRKRRRLEVFSDRNTVVAEFCFRPSVHHIKTTNSGELQIRQGWTGKKGIFYLGGVFASVYSRGRLPPRTPNVSPPPLDRTVQHPQRISTSVHRAW